MDQETLALLDYPRLLALIRDLAQSPLGKAEVDKLQPIGGL